MSRGTANTRFEIGHASTSHLLDSMMSSGVKQLATIPSNPILAFLLFHCIITSIGSGRFKVRGLSLQKDRTSSILDLLAWLSRAHCGYTLPPNDLRKRLHSLTQVVELTFLFRNTMTLL